MRRARQLSLFGLGQGKGYLFERGHLNAYLQEHKTTQLAKEAELAKRLRAWMKSLAATTATETALEGKFVSEVFCGVLGFTTYPTPSGVSATIFAKPGTAFTGLSKGVPDAALGEFAGDEVRISAVVELKSPGTDLDAPQPTHGAETPIEQGFRYGTRILGARWVIVSDMRRLRLYSVESAGEYEEIDLDACTESDGTPTAEFRRLQFLFHYDYLVKGDDRSHVYLLYLKSSGQQLEIRDSFYGVYYDVRADLYRAIAKASAELDPPPTRSELLQATQRLLDRMLFIFYCEDHPQQLIRAGTFENTVAAAQSLPGADTFKIYKYLKHLFREIDTGSPVGSGIEVDGYNGELFKDHWIIDHIDLPDELSKKRYFARERLRGQRLVNGIWGLHIYDFWTELNEHLLGHVFEESLSDLQELGTSDEVPIRDKMIQRKKGGIFYTSRILSDFLTHSAIESVLRERAPLREGGSADEITTAIKTRISTLGQLRIVDFACGSGAFLVSAYRELLYEFWKLRASLDAIAADPARDADLFRDSEPVTQASLLRQCLFGADLLPQAVEIAKLALWLRSAKKGEKVANLSERLVATDSLQIDDLFTMLNTPPGTFDLVIGNPPWGSDVSPATHKAAVEYLKLDEGEKWDSWELFVVLALVALRDGGRLALVLPDSLLYPEKARVRRIIFQLASVEKVHNLGPDWFGKNVRMGTVIVQARRGSLLPSNLILCALALGKIRDAAIKGKLPLTQIEEQRSKLVPTSRALESPSHDLEIFRGVADDAIMGKMSARSTELGTICRRGRGEEMSKTGLQWVCPNCLSPTVPGAKDKGGGYKDKNCPKCGHHLTESNVQEAQLVTPFRPDGDAVTFIDGDDVNHRYQAVVPHKWLRLGVSGWEYKDPDVYHPPKILIRQAGVGLTATLDVTASRCPQSMYIYRLTDEATAKGYALEFVLGTLLSRTMLYFVFKRFAEVDPAKAHAKMTHDRLAALPIPIVDFGNPMEKGKHDQIVRSVRRLLAETASVGGEDDSDIELALRGLWGISPGEGAYINGEFFDLPEGQVLSDMFPSGRPRPARAMAGSI